MQELEIEKRFLVPEEKLEELMVAVIADSKKMMNDVYIPNDDGNKHPIIKGRIFCISCRN